MKGREGVKHGGAGGVSVSYAKIGYWIVGRVVLEWNRRSGLIFVSVLNVRGKG